MISPPSSPSPVQWSSRYATRTTLPAYSWRTARRLGRTGMTHRRSGCAGRSRRKARSQERWRRSLFPAVTASVLPRLYVSHLQHRRHRHMVGRAFPAAGRAGDLEIAHAFAERTRHPDVVEPAAAVGGGPVERAIAPPGVDLFRQRNSGARDVDPVALSLAGQ